jgi:hypothetical protein
MSTMQPREVTGCIHGSPKLDQKRKAAFEEYYERMHKTEVDLQTKHESSGTHLRDHQQEQINSSFDFIKQFWSEPNHACLIDAEMVRSCFAFATVQALEGNMAFSRRFSMLGTFLTAWFKLGQDSFLEELRGVNPESPNIQTMLEFQASLTKINTDRGLVISLAKQIPCSCLDEDKKYAKQAPKIGRCSYCRIENLKMELKKCSQCKMVEYCSKECQVADWRAEHKKDCKGYQHLHEQSAALKAQARR